MRIAYVLTQDRGGPVDATVYLARELAASGHDEVRLFGPPPARCPPDLLPALDEARVDQKSDLAAMRRLRRRIRAWRPDVVHAQDRRAMLVVAGAPRSAVAGARRVATYHGVPGDVLPTWFALRRGAQGPSAYSRTVLAADALVARRLDRLVVPSPATGRFVARRLRLAPWRVEHIDNGVPAHDSAASDPGDRSVRRLLYAGVLVEQKGLRELLTALARVRADGVDLELGIAGDGPARADLERHADVLGLGDVVRFLGFRLDVRALMAAGDAVVLPSRMEQQPLVLIEALMAGKPVLATRVGGVEDMLDGVVPDGLLVPPSDVTELARGLHRLAALRRPPGTAARCAEIARARFDVRTTAAAHRRLYRSLVPSPADGLGKAATHPGTTR